MNATHLPMPPAFGKADFPLTKFAGVLAGMLEELEHGRGFFLMRGFPIERYSYVEDFRLTRV